MMKIRPPFVLLFALAAPAAAQRLPAPLPPMSTPPPAYGQDMISSGIGERTAQLRTAVGDAFQRGLIGRDQAERLSLPLARMEQQLQFHTPRSYRERVRLRQRLDAIQAELDRYLAHG
ncbi:MAG: hypothetical protein JO013_12670 [Alphaproteobacteria bacterium]|nr:hypothetical protein [Alphaproteobacteria bacterium]